MYKHNSMQKFIRKMWLFLLGILISFSIIPSFYLQAWLATPGQPSSLNQERSSNPKMGRDDISNDDSIWQWSTNIWNKSIWILHFPQANNYKTRFWYTLALIQVIINWTLGMLMFVVLIYVLYCGFLILSAWSDDKNTSKGKSWIKTAAIAIAWIGLSWMIISAMIWFINNITWAK